MACNTKKALTYSERMHDDEYSLDLQFQTRSARIP